MRDRIARTDRPIPYGFRVSQIARERPDEVAILFRGTGGELSSITWSELDRSTNQIARLLAERGVQPGHKLLLGYPNSIEHYQGAIAIWKLGACSVQISFASPPRELQRLAKIAESRLVLGEWPDLEPNEQVRRADLRSSSSLSDEPLPERVSMPGVGMSTGGSTGLPKIVITDGAWAKVPGEFSHLQKAAGLAADQRQLVAGPLYHNAPFNWSHNGLFEGHTLVVMQRFDAAAAVELIGSQGINWVFLVPTMMARIARLPGLDARDFSALHSVFHASAPCPEWVKRFWIDLLGPTRVREGFGPSEGFSTTVISGAEWLQHPGSVGKPFHCDIKVLDDQDQAVAIGEVGEIYGRVHGVGEPGYRYLGAPPAKSTSDGYQSAGDLGWFDVDGYLYVADRRVDMIIRGGANIYPAEIEGALIQHSAVFDAVVVGLPHADLGQVVHAIVRPVHLGQPPSVESLDHHLRLHIAPYKLPASYEFVTELPRDDAGKVRRVELATARKLNPPQAIPAPHRSAG